MATPRQEQDLYSSYIRDQSWIILSHLLVYAKGIILLPILVKNLGIELYGMYVLLIITGDLLFGVSSLGVGYQFRRHMPSARSLDTRQTLFYSQFLLHLIFIVGICVGWYYAHAVFDRAMLNETAQYSIELFCSLLMLNFFFGKLTDYLRFTDRQKYLAIILATNPYLAIGIIVLFLVLLDSVGINHLLLASVVAMTVLSIPLLLQVVRELGLRLPKIRVRQTLEDIRLGFPLVLAYMVDFILSSSDRYLIALFLSASSVGLYNPAYALGSLIILIPKALGIALPPILARAIDEGREAQAETLIRHSVRAYLVFAVPFFVGCLLLGRPILELFANAEVADASHMLVSVIALGILFYGLNAILVNVLFVKGRTDLIFKVTLLSAGMNLVLNVVLLNIYRSITVAAVTTLASYVVAFVITNHRVKTMFNLVYEPRLILRILLCSGAMGILVTLLMMIPGDSVSVILFTVFCAIIFYLYCILLTKVYSLDDLRVLARNPGRDANHD